MKYIPKLFIETTIFNFYFEGKQGQKQLDTVKLFEEIARGKYEAYTSQGVIDELKKSPVEKYKKMYALLEKYINKMLTQTQEAERMAGIYTEKKIFPAKTFADAIHIAIASVNNLDFVISYNLGHIVKTKTMIGAGLANLRAGYRQIGISTPMEVLEYDC